MMSPATLCSILVAVLVGAAPATLVNDASPVGGNMQEGPDARESIAAEYARLKARGTREALELFIARHPGDPLSEKARQEIERLYGKTE